MEKYFLFARCYSNIRTSYFESMPLEAYEEDMSYRPNEHSLTIELAGKPRHPKTVHKLMNLLPDLSRLDTPLGKIASEWMQSIRNQLEEMDTSIVPKLKRLSGHDKTEETSQRFDARLAEPDLDYFYRRVLDGLPPDKVKGVEFFDAHTAAYEMMLLFGDYETAYNFGFFEYIKYDDATCVHYTLTGEMAEAIKLVDSIEKPEDLDYVKSNVSSILHSILRTSVSMNEEKRRDIVEMLTYFTS